MSPSTQQRLAAVRWSSRRFGAITAMSVFDKNRLPTNSRYPDTLFGRRRFASAPNDWNRLTDQRLEAAGTVVAVTGTVVAEKRNQNARTAHRFRRRDGRGMTKTNYVDRRPTIIVDVRNSANVGWNSHALNWDAHSAQQLWRKRWATTVDDNVHTSRLTNITTLPSVYI